MPTIGNLGTMFVRGENKKLVPVPCIHGKNGITPHIGENGNWWIGDTDTGAMADNKKYPVSASVYETIITGKPSEYTLEILLKDGERIRAKLPNMGLTPDDVVKIGIGEPSEFDDINYKQFYLDKNTGRLYINTSKMYPNSYITIGGVVLSGENDPTGGEDAYINNLYINTTTGAIFLCVRMESFMPSEPPYPVWQQIGGTGGDVGTDITLGITGAVVGQTVKIMEVDEDGRPVKWEAADIPAQTDIDTTLSVEGSAADAKAVGDKLTELSSAIEKKVSDTAITLGVNKTDGLVYIFVNGIPVGAGLKIEGSIIGDGDTVELSDGTILTTLMFSDDFDGDSLGSTWKMSAWNNESSYITPMWTDREANVGVADSCVRLTLLRDNPVEGRELSSGAIDTNRFGVANNYTWDTGYLEVKFKLDKVGEGIWPAIWCLGDTQSQSYTKVSDTLNRRTVHGLKWPWAGEIDQLDGMKSQFKPTLIYQTDPYDESYPSMYGPSIYTLEADTWYTIGLFKSKEKIKVYLDRTLIAEFEIAGNECFSGRAYNIILQLNSGTVGGTLPEDINEVNMYVDYVKVYSLGDSYTTMADQNTTSLLPEQANGYACVSNRKFLLRPQYALNTQNAALYWASSNAEVATVENGYVTTVADGECNIIATDIDGNEIINFLLTVTADAGILATDIEVTSVVSQIGAGSSAEISANIYPTHCDVLTPTLTVLSGSEYCTVDGLTITNTNATGVKKEVTIRVGTNNPDVYEDVVVEMGVISDYAITPADNLLANYNVSGMAQVSDGSTTWADSLGFGNTFAFASNTTFDGTSIYGTNAIWNFTVSNNLPITNEVPEQFTVMVLVDLDGVAIPISFNRAESNIDRLIINNETQVALANSSGGNTWKRITVPSNYATKMVYAYTYNNGAAKGYAIDPDGNVYSGDFATDFTRYEDIPSIRVFTYTNGFVGRAYQALLFNVAYEQDDITAFAAQMFEKN